MAHAHSHRYLNDALGHDIDDDEGEVPSNAERRTPNAATHEWRQIARVRTTRPDVATATVTMTATVAATVVVLHVSCDESLSRRRTAERRMPTTNDMTARRHAQMMSSRARGDCGT